MVAKNPAAAVAVTAQIAGSVAKTATLGASVTMAGLSVANIHLTKIIAASATATASVTATAALDKIIAAAASATISVIASALLGKRLEGSLEVDAATNAVVALSVNMGGSLVSLSTALGELAKDAPLAGDLLATASSSPMLYVERTIRSQVDIACTVRGLLVFTHLVDASSGKSSTFTQSVSNVYASAQLIDTWLNHIQVEVDPSVYQTKAEVSVEYPILL